MFCIKVQVPQLKIKSVKFIILCSKVNRCILIIKHFAPDITNSEVLSIPAKKKRGKKKRQKQPFKHDIPKVLLMKRIMKRYSLKTTTPIIQKIVPHRMHLIGQNEGQNNEAHFRLTISFSNWLKCKNGD